MPEQGGMELLRLGRTWRWVRAGEEVKGFWVGVADPHQYPWAHCCGYYTLHGWPQCLWAVAPASPCPA